MKQETINNIEGAAKNIACTTVEVGVAIGVGVASMGAEGIKQFNKSFKDGLDPIDPQRVENIKANTRQAWSAIKSIFKSEGK